MNITSEADSQGDQDLATRIELRLVISRTEQLEGTVGPRQSAGTPFHGWVELMSAVEALRRAPPPTNPK
jgi:hypothetical protein